MNMKQIVHLAQTCGYCGLRFAGPDLLDYVMIFYISGGIYHGDRLRIESSYHPCCGTLEINANLMKKYKRWFNKLDGCKQHRRDEGGDRRIRDILWDITVITQAGGSDTH